MMQVIAVNPFIFAVAAVIANIQQAVGDLCSARWRQCHITSVLLSVQGKFNWRRQFIRLADF